MTLNNRDIQLHLVNVFPSSTSTRTARDNGNRGGNLAPIALNATGLTDDDMRAVARKYGRESAFVFPAAPGIQADFQLRFCVPEHEMEMCGHATVGTAWVMRELGIEASGSEEARATDGGGEEEAWTNSQEITFSTKAGLVRTRWLTPTGSEIPYPHVSQPQGTVEDITSPALITGILSVLGITDEGLATGIPIQNARTSRVKTTIPIENVALLNCLTPDFSRVEDLCKKLGSTGLYPYAVVRERGRVDGDSGSGSNSKDVLELEARQFPKASGYPEDAATGIAASGLAYALERNGVLEVGEEVIVLQGMAIGFPSRIHVILEEGACWVGGMCTWGKEII